MPAATRVTRRPRGVTPLYSQTFRRAIDDVLPVSVVPAEWGRTGKRWKDRQVALCALFMGWGDGRTAKDRFAAARRGVAAMYPGRPRPGASYNGFMAALGRYTAASLAGVQEHLRAEMRRRLGGPDGRGRHWLYKGRWVLVAADGSKVDVPDTAANEAAFGTAGRGKCGPQQYVTTLYHLASGLPWGWARGGARASERGHLRGMLGLLPDKALLVADAGFTGYDLLADLIRAGKDFLIRVGANVKLLTKLGHAEERAGTVYLWPDGKRDAGDEPLVLRLVRVVKGRGKRRRVVYLLTNVRDKRILSDAAAGRVYRMRWGVEVMYRSLKQTLEARTMRSDSPARAGVELDWALLGLWVLGLMCVGQVLTTRRPPREWSPAAALRVVRTAIDRPGDKSPGGGVLGELRRAVLDDYDRAGPKRARHRRDKKKDKPPGKPKARNARTAEVLLAKELWQKKRAA